MIFAAFGGCIKNGMLNSFLSVIAVFTKPGLTVMTLIFMLLKLNTGCFKQY